MGKQPRSCSQPIDSDGVKNHGDDRAGHLQNPQGPLYHRVHLPVGESVKHPEKFEMWKVRGVLCLLSRWCKGKFGIMLMNMDGIKIETEESIYKYY